MKGPVVATPSSDLLFPVPQADHRKNGVNRSKDTDPTGSAGTSLSRFAPIPDICQAFTPSRSMPSPASWPTGEAALETRRHPAARPGDTPVPPHGRWL